MWAIDIKGLSNQAIVDLLELLENDSNHDLQGALRRELVSRLRNKHGWSDEKIIHFLAQNVPKGPKRKKLANKWAEVFGISVREFNQISGGR